MRNRFRDYAAHVWRRATGRNAEDANRIRIDALALRLDERLSNLEALFVGPPLIGAGASGGGGSPVVSVIIPTRNRSAMLREAVRSVQNQTMTNWELVIVDDGSSDDTPAVIEDLAADPRVLHVRLAGVGAANARNVGVAQSRAPFLAYLDDDNLWFPSFLCAVIEGFAVHPETDFAYGALAAESTDPSVSPIMWKAFDRTDLLHSNFIDTSAMVHRRSLIEQFGGWDNQMHPFEDWDLALRYTSEKPALRLPVLAVRYRTHASDRASNSPEKRHASERFREKWRLG